MKNNKYILYFVLLVVIIILYLNVRNAYIKNPVNISNENTVNSTNQESIATSTIQIANPASVNCKNVGGNLTIEKKGDGSEYGLCHFDDNRACEEWALMRGECPVGGRKTTGYDTIDQNFCAWSGGQTYAVANSICTFKDDRTCSTIDFYNGKCK